MTRTALTALHQSHHHNEEFIRALTREASGEGTLILWLCTQAREQYWRQREATAGQQQRQAERWGRSRAEFSQLADSLSGD